METNGNYKRALKIFVASPGDVPAERDKAREILLALNRHPLYGKSIVLEPYLWDDPHAGTPMSYPNTPEESIIRYGERPAQCELLIGILKHRLGTPLPIEPYGHNSNGEPFTGTEWEIHDAFTTPGARTNEAFVFVSNEDFRLPRGLDAAQRQELQQQNEKVERFLEGLRGGDGSYNRAVNNYDDIDDFALKLRNAVEHWLEHLLREQRTPPPVESARGGPKGKALRPQGDPSVSQITPLLTFGLDLENGEIRSRLITPCAAPMSAVLTTLTTFDDRLATGDLNVLREALWGAEPLRRFRDMVQNCLEMAPPDDFTVVAMRLRIIMRDHTLAALPWHCISDQDHPLGKVGWVIETIVADQAEPLPVLDKPVENPLILAPADPELDIGAAVHAAEVQDALRALLGGRGQTVTWARTREELEFQLKQDPPDLIYCFTLFADTQSLLLDSHGGSGRQPLRLQELAGLLEQSCSKPLLWLNLIESNRQRPDWQTLLPHCRLLMVHRTRIAQPEAATEPVLDWLDRMQVGERNPSALISTDADPASLVIHSGAPVRLRLPAPETDSDAWLHARIRTALLRILLGREPEKNMLYGYTTGAGDGALIAYVAAGDEQACVHDFPAQIRHRLEQNLDDGIRVVTRFVPVTLRDAATSVLEIARLFKRHLRPTGDPLREALEALIRHPPLEGESVIIALPWLVDLRAGITADNISAWMLEWARFHAESLIPEIPDRCRVLLGACICVESHCPLSPEEVLQAANAAVMQAAASESIGAATGFEPVKLNEPLGKLSQDHLHRFYTHSPIGPRLLPRDLDARRLAAWIINQTKTHGGFSETVDLIYREYKDAYADFQRHEQQR